MSLTGSARAARGASRAWVSLAGIAEAGAQEVGVHAQLGERPAGAAVGILQRGEQEVVGSDVAVAALERLAQRLAEDGARVGRDPARAGGGIGHRRRRWWRPVDQR